MRTAATSLVLQFETEVRFLLQGHNGDSVAYAEANPISDAYLQGLIDRLAADPQDVTAQLYAQPGAFNARFVPTKLYGQPAPVDKFSYLC